MRSIPKPEAFRAYIVDCLESWSTRNRKISVLRYELEHCAHVTPEEMIDAMNYSRGDDVDRAKIRTSNDPRYIAPSYREKVTKINDEMIAEISGQLSELEREQGRLDHYISLLNERGKIILKMYYLEGLTLTAIAQKLYLLIGRLKEAKSRP